MLKLLNIKKSFGGSKVLRDVTLSVSQGEVIGLSGGNGAGKSTLLNIATGFLSADGGKLSFNDTELNSLEPWQFSRLGIKRSFQTARFNLHLTLKDQLYLGKTSLRKNQNVILDSGIGKFLTSFPSETPPAILRKVEVVRALISEPKIIFLDEPSAGLSKTEIEEFATFIGKHRPTTVTLVIVEHRMDLMRKINAKVISLRNGSISEKDQD